MRFAKSMPFIFLLGVVLFCQSSKGEFVGNVERFNGTVKDTVTWSEYLLNPGPSRITQNDAVTFEGSTDYCTNTITVGIGQAVRVDVLNVTDLGSFGIFALSLSGHNDGASTGNYLRMSCVYNSGSDNWSLIGQHEMPVGGTTGSFFGTTSTPTFSTAPLALEVERVSLTMAYYRAYSGNDLLGGTYLTFSDVPEQLYIRLENTSFTTTFDNVTILPIPEPATLVLFGIGGSGLVRYSRKRRK